MDQRPGMAWRLHENVLHGWDGDGEHGLTIAQLKRILDILNQALTAADAMPDKSLAPECRAAHQTALFAIREDILALLARLRG
jgi:hypothetical protein